MFFLKTQHLADLAVGEQSLILADLVGEGHVRKESLRKLFRWRIGRDGVVGSVEDLVAETVLLDAEMAYLPEVAGIDIAPGDTLAHLGMGEIGRKLLVLVRLDDVADTQRIDIEARTFGKGARVFSLTTLERP